ncbi:MAG: GTPase Era [Patescibacteria group bacterium]
MKQGTVLLVGRPNVGKSTFLNNLIGHKVAITSPKPQTTRFPIQAVYEDDRGQIMFIDTPGIFGKAEDNLSKKINDRAIDVLEKEVDVVLYMVDHTRRRDFEEGRVLGLVRKLNVTKKILVVNKIDLQDKSYLAQYRFLEEEVDEVYAISALLRKHIDPLMEGIFEALPEVADDAPSYKEDTPHALQNIDSHIFVAELIREKIFLHTGKEVPYSATVRVDEIIERENGTMYIQARILTVHDRYKKMLIGKGGEKVKDLGRLARKEIELAINKKVYLDLTVETDPHWQETLY